MLENLIDRCELQVLEGHCVVLGVKIRCCSPFSRQKLQGRFVAPKTSESEMKSTSFPPRPGVYLLSAHVRPQRSQPATVVEDTVTSTSISPHSSQHNRWPGGRRNTEGERQGEHHRLSFDISCPPEVFLCRATNQMRYGYVKEERVLLLTCF